MQKYQAYYREMVSQNKSLFEEFTKIHDLYASNQDKWKKDFNEIGEKTLEVIKKWEGKLCSKTEGGSFNKFSSGLADKFWGEVRKNFIYIDFIGVK